MKGNYRYTGCSLLLFALFSLQSQMAFAVYSMSETCTQLPMGYIADPSDCKSYGYCANGTLWGTRKCDDGFLYDARLGQCNYAEKIKCATSLESTCTNTNSPMYVADPDDCSQCCYCNGNGKYTCVSCPDNQLFNPNTRSCVWSRDYQCPADSICRLVKDNTFVGDPEICGNYLACFAGSGVSSDCADGYWFNPERGSCDTANICVGKPVDPTPGVGSGVESNLPPNKALCSKGYKPQPDGKPYYLGDDTTCMGYYVCLSASGPGTWLKCPMGTHFSEEEQKCVTPYTVKCQHDRCGNIDQQYVSALGCLAYHFCVNQTNVAPNGNKCSSVSSEYKYFDEYSGACVDDMPSYNICTKP